MPTVDLDEYARHDATALAELVARKEISPRELAACVVAGVERVDPSLNAVVEVYAARAQALDDTVPPGPFGGVPTMLKDLFHGEAGSVCENGSRLAAGWVTPADSELTARIRASGLVNLGRTATSEFGIMGTTETLAAGRTCSPWSAEHMAGGSSGGAAAVVGAGIVPVASASDGGGSIRIPASACGTVGLKPSRGRVTWGPQIAEALFGWAVHFMVTRSVRDTAGLLDCLAGPAPGDPFVIAPPERPFRSEVGAPVGRLRVAWCSDPWSGDAVDPQVAAATKATAELLGELGHEVAAVHPAFAWEPFLQAMTDVWAADAAHTVDSFAATAGREPGADTLEGATLAAVEYGRTVTRQPDRRRAGAGERAGPADGHLLPRVRRTADPDPGPAAGAARAVRPDRADRRCTTSSPTWSPLESFLPVFNATGQPAISLPLHQSTEGLPIGMQLVGAGGAESLLLRLAAQLEEALPWSGRRPPLHVANPA